MPEKVADLNKIREFSAYLNETLRHKTTQTLVQKKWRCFMLTDGWTYKRKEGKTDERMENTTKVVATTCNFVKAFKWKILGNIKGIWFFVVKGEIA